MRKILVLCCLIAGSAASAFAEAPAPRLVTVTGEGETFAVPDQVVVNLQVESFDATVALAKRTNDDAVKKLLGVMKSFKIDPKDFQTDYFNVRPEERYFLDEKTGQQRSKRGYYVSKNVAVKLKDVSKFEDLYSAALEAGVNNVNGVSFKSVDEKKMRETARAMAMADAKDKASKMAAALGAELSRPYTIQENFQSDGGYPRPMMLMAKADMAGGAANNETVALGQIRVTASATVSFELK